MFKIADSILKQLPPFAKKIIDEDLDSIEFKAGGKMTITLIKVSKAQKAYEQGLVLSYPIEMYSEEFLILHAPIKK
jgi:hypothetical protein